MRAGGARGARREAGEAPVTSRRMVQAVLVGLLATAGFMIAGLVAATVGAIAAGLEEGVRYYQRPQEEAALEAARQQLARRRR